MPYKFWIRLAAGIILVATIAVIVRAWISDRRERAELYAELAATKKTLAEADARQHDRDAQLQQSLADLARQKQTVTSPVQIVRELPSLINLPAPITTAPPSSADSLGSQSTGPNSSASPPAQNQNAATQLSSVVLPASDLKPLYDFALDCKACQAKLATSQADLADEKVKTAALTKERDQALQVAKGGSAWRRIRRAAKWFVLGAAAGAIAARAKH